MTPIRRKHASLQAVGATLALTAGFATDGSLAATLGACDSTTLALREACPASARDDLKVATAVCLNIANPADAQSCNDDAQSAFNDATGQCGSMQSIRVSICRKLGQSPYDPAIHPSNFVPTITNPYSPFKPGNWWEYRAQTPDGVVRDRVEVLDQPRVIVGVTVTTVRDRLWEDGVLVEDTLDWLAQDRAGNIWYFGEVSKSLEDGVLVDIDGSWEAGRNGAKPGIWLRGLPVAGETYRQEFDPDNAEDMADVVTTHSGVAVPFGNGNPVLKTHEYTALEPGADEYKYYVPGVGLVREFDPTDVGVMDLVDYGPR